jgi:glycine/D-amino acid oxidase-like deaminating enzyme
MVNLRDLDNIPAWDDGSWQGFPSLSGETTADVCVVGLGGSGLSCVTALLAHRLSVVGLDAGLVAGGAAGRNGGFLLAGSADFYHRAVERLGREAALSLYRRTMVTIASMARQTPAAVRQVGSLRIVADEAEAADVELQLAAMRADGLPVERYDGPEGQGLLFPADAAFDPMARSRTLATRAAARGARLFEKSAARQIEPGSVRTDHGTVHARHVVVAVDGRLASVLPELAGRVRDVRLQMLATAPTGEVHLDRPVYTRFGYDYWQQLSDGRIVLGGCRDVGGEEEFTSDPTPSEMVQGALVRLLRERVGVQAPITHRWAAIVSYTDGGQPICGEVRPGVWALGGYSGTGNVIGAMLGAQVAARIAERA